MNKNAKSKDTTTLIFSNFLAIKQKDKIHISFYVFNITKFTNEVIICIFLKKYTTSLQRIN